MEEKKLKMNGLQLVDINSSELCNISGGINIGNVRRFVKACLEAIDTIMEFLPPFSRGFYNGWYNATH